MVDMRDGESPQGTSRKMTPEDDMALRRARGELSCAECKRLKLKCNKKLPCGACVRRECPTLCPHGSLADGKFNPEDTEERKRARGELSCVECKRLKLKCDKKLPCGACIRRGCETTCPQGTLATRQKASPALSVPPEVEELHRKISEMSERIRQLEDALALLQDRIGSEEHPLLRDGLLSVKFGPEKRQSAELESPPNSLVETVDAFGTLAIGDCGESRYFGASAGSETLLSTESEPGIPSSRNQGIPELLNNLAAMFSIDSRCPTGPETFENAMSMFFSCLPSRPRAWSLCESFTEHCSWLYRPLQREELIQDILNPIYMAKEEREDPNCLVATEISPHKFSCLYSVFSQGALADLAVRECSEEGDRYHHCARAALALRSIFDSPMVETVQAILIMSYYCNNFAQRYSRDSIWMLVSLGSKVAQSIGMHRDPAQWNIDPTVAERRRALFWEVYSADMYHSLSLGRPPSIALSYVDCALPHSQSDSESEAQYWNWKYQFNRTILGRVLETTLGSKSPEYKTILDFDQQVREMPLPAALNFYLGRGDDASLTEHLKGGYLSMIRSITMLYIHKSHFARALLDHPANPLRSPYATSFLAAARCSSVIIRSSVGNMQRVPEFYMSWWVIWTHIFSAAMISGLIVTRAPSSIQAPEALHELGIAVDLFQKGARVSPRVRTGMDILRRLQEKGTFILAQHRGGTNSPTATLPIPHGKDDNADEFVIFSGQTRGPIGTLLPQRSLSFTDKASGTSSSPELPAVSFTGSTSTHSQSTEGSSPSSANHQLMGMSDVHPSLLEFMSGFPGGETVPILTANQASAASLPPDEGQYQASLTDSPSPYPLWQLYSETLATDTWGMNNDSEPGTESHGGCGIDEDWVMFLKESGL
ncbi:hypothetical protein FIBSPDRAFT_1046131 [Athelia psychrophila]|uniref:Zn(2)-C6 fungal-type domain-containing protein n=1 Tax=Athelia psychrophila TaxID=1759441 RepID=A0A166HA32_9AGAM|nr:hypothetical protein FIBSPDRAFT_1046131 [Fibularhizoctonia sp. CBS 109695]